MSGLKTAPKVHKPKMAIDVISTPNRHRCLISTSIQRKNYIDSAQYKVTSEWVARAENIRK